MANYDVVGAWDNLDPDSKVRVINSASDEDLEKWAADPDCNQKLLCATALSKRRPNVEQMALKSEERQRIEDEEAKLLAEEPPHGLVNRTRDFSVYLRTVILSVIIALSLGGLIEWYLHQSLAEEARSNLAAEILENRQLVKRAIRSDPRSRLKATIEAIDAYRKNHRDDRTSNLRWGFGPSELPTAAWSRAAGALGYMDYSEVQEYARAYALQEQFLTLWQSTSAKWADLQKWEARRDPKGSLSNLNN